MHPGPEKESRKSRQGAPTYLTAKVRSTQIKRLGQSGYLSDRSFQDMCGSPCVGVSQTRMGRKTDERLRGHLRLARVARLTNRVNAIY
jgi:hypothetical protein